MNTSFRLKPFPTILSFTTFLLAFALLADDQTGNASGLTELDEHTVHAESLENESILPLAYDATGVFPNSTNIAKLPRAVIMLPGQLSRDLNIDSYDTLYRVGAGTQRPNYLGIAGTPYLRGDDAGLYFNGMPRAYQLLAFPRSFNSVDGQIIVKGLAPAHLGASPAGGYVNQIAKRPDGEADRASVAIGSYSHYAGSLDVSQSTEAWGQQWKTLLSVSGQESERFFRDARDDRRSVFIAMETNWNARISTYSAAEFYQWRGNENPGWNRLTQALIDRGEYIAGEPAVSAWTATLEPDEVLIAPEDEARADNFLYYLETQWQSERERTFSHKLLLETFDADKHSPSNDYAFSGEQLLVGSRLMIEQHIAETSYPTDLAWGTDMQFIQFDERFAFSNALDSVAIQDISHRVGTSGPGAFNSISQGDVFQLGAFLSARTRWTDRLSTFVSARADATRFDAEAVNSTRGQKNAYQIGFAPVLQLNQAHNLYLSIQHGSATIPGEGGAITSERNFGESELYEIGMKSTLFDGELFNTLALYYWDKDAFDSRTGANERFRAQGFEWELTYQPSKRFYVLGAFTAQRTWRRGGPPARLGAFNPNTNPTHTFLPEGSALPNNPDAVVPGTPEVQFKFFAVAETPNGMRLGGGPLWSDGFWTSYDRLFRAPSSLVWNGFASYSHETWTLRLDVENITNERYFTGSDPNYFGNALITPAPGRLLELSLSRKF